MAVEGQKHNLSVNSSFDGGKEKVEIFGNFENSIVPILNARKGVQRRRRLANYRMLFEYSRESLLIIDLKGNILEANRAAIRAYGYTREELCTMKIHNLRAEQTLDLINLQVRDAYARGITFETCHVRKNGEQFPVEVSSHQVVGGYEKILLSAIRDISERKRLEKELVLSENINTIEKVAACLAHEIRNPLTSVYGFLQLAASQKIDQITFVESCNSMLQELDRVNSVMTDLIVIATEKKIDYPF
ncbi:MAG: PAS domain S-box protein [Desulfosporosinus sp.]|nr:PAS domain S-box protein [Desulfosporosinus sp.]